MSASTLRIFGLPIANVTLENATNTIISAAQRNEKRHVFFVNAHCVNVAAQDKEYLQTLQSIDGIYPDGSGLALAAKLLGSKLVDNPNGTDLFPMLCERAAADGVPIAFIGAKPGVAEECARRMTERFPALKVVCTEHGYFNRTEERQVIERLNASGAKILLVAMGVPAQELWISRCSPKLSIPVLIAVGGLFDFYSGRRHRAPLILRKTGMEWTFRLAQEPVRLFKRYILGNPLFIARTLRMRMSDSLSDGGRIFPVGDTTEALSTPAITLAGIPFDHLNILQAVTLIDQMVANKNPHYFATADVDLVLESLHDVELRRVLLHSHMVLCDSVLLLWASRLLGNPLPDQVSATEVGPLLVRTAARKGYKIFLLGGTEAKISKILPRLKRRHPDLEIAGTYAPPVRSLLEMDHDEIKRRIQETKPDILFVAFGSPKQEKWIAMNYRALGVPVVLGVGHDFVSLLEERAPRWMRKTGTEWLFRAVQEPRRVLHNYVFGLWMFFRILFEQWRYVRKSKTSSAATQTTVPGVEEPNYKKIRIAGHLDIQTAKRESVACEQALASNPNLVLDLSAVTHLDSTGIGLLIRLQKKARITGRKFILLSPSEPVRTCLEMMRLQDFFKIARDLESARSMLAATSGKTVIHQPSYFPSRPSLFWQGEVTAENSDQVWEATAPFISKAENESKQVLIDLSALSFVDSSGLGVMVRAKKAAAAVGIDLRFVNAQGTVRNVLKTSRLEKYLLYQSQARLNLPEDKKLKPEAIAALIP